MESSQQATLASEAMRSVHVAPRVVYRRGPFWSPDPISIQRTYATTTATTSTGTSSSDWRTAAHRPDPRDTNGGTRARAQAADGGALLWVDVPSLPLQHLHPSPVGPQSLRRAAAPSPQPGVWPHFLGRPQPRPQISWPPHLPHPQPPVRTLSPGALRQHQRDGETQAWRQARAQQPAAAMGDTAWTHDDKLAQQQAAESDHTQALRHGQQADPQGGPAGEGPAGQVPAGEVPAGEVSAGVAQQHSHQDRHPSEPHQQHIPQEWSHSHAPAQPPSSYQPMPQASSDEPRHHQHKPSAPLTQQHQHQKQQHQTPPARKLDPSVAMGEVLRRAVMDAGTPLPRATDSRQAPAPQPPAHTHPAASGVIGPHSGLPGAQPAPLHQQYSQQHSWRSTREDAAVLLTSAGLWQHSPDSSQAWNTAPAHQHSSAVWTAAPTHQHSSAAWTAAPAHQEPTARPIPELLASLPPLPSLPSLHSVMHQVSHVNDRIDQSLRQLEALSCLQALSALTCLSSLSSLATLSPDLAPDGLQQSGRQQQQQQQQRQRGVSTAVPVHSETYRYYNLHHPSILPEEAGRKQAGRMASPEAAEPTPGYGSRHLTTSHLIASPPAPSLRQPSPYCHYMGYREVPTPQPASSAAGASQPLPDGRDPSEPPLLSRLYPHIDSAALEVDLAEEHAKALVIQARQAAALAQGRVVPREQLAVVSSVMSETRGAENGRRDRADKEVTAVNEGEAGAGLMGKDRVLELPMNIDEVVKPPGVPEAGEPAQPAERTRPDRIQQARGGVAATASSTASHMGPGLNLLADLPPAASGFSGFQAGPVQLSTPAPLTGTSTRPGPDRPVVPPASGGSPSSSAASSPTRAAPQPGTTAADAGGMKGLGARTRTVGRSPLGQQASKSPSLSHLRAEQSAGQGSGASQQGAASGSSSTSTSSSSSSSSSSSRLDGIVSLSSTGKGKP